MKSKDNFKIGINNLNMEVLIYIFINDFKKFEKIMPYIDNEKLKVIYTELKNLDPTEY